MAKLFALARLGELIDGGAVDPTMLADRRSVLPVADSGLWQHLAVDQLPITDVAQLIGAVSDNLATNVLLAELGLDAVQATARRLAPAGSMLHDILRDQRGPDDPETVSTGCAEDWTRFFSLLDGDDSSSPRISPHVLRWLAANTDLSQAASAFDLDPLSHVAADQGLLLWNKTGTDIGVRADVGLVERAGTRLAYAVICNWDDSGNPDERRLVLGTMREFGLTMRRALDPDGNW